MRAVAVTRVIASEVIDMGPLADLRISCVATLASEAIDRTAASRRESAPATRVPHFGLPAAAMALADLLAHRVTLCWVLMTRSALPMLAAALVFVVCAFPEVTASAQGKLDFIRAVGAIETDSEEIEAPAGLAFSTRANEFLVLETPGGWGQPSRGIKRLDDARGVTGHFVLSAAITNPINMAFDEANERLLLIHPRSSKLIQIGAGANGVPRPDVVSEVGIEHLGVSDPQGMAVDPDTGDLFILDAAWPQIVRVTPDPIRGFEWPQVSVIDLGQRGLEASTLRGLALDPESGHLHVLSPGAQRLYEVKETGVIVANRDISGLGLRDPQGLVFAPSRDRTDEPSVMHLFVADSGNDPGGAERVGAGQITEISLRATAANVTRFEQGVR